jgi:AraC-like DNA-binding protein
MQLERVWSTSQAQRGHALPYWQEIVCKNLLELQIASSRPADFFGRISQTAIGPLKANFITVSEQRVWRPRQAAHVNHEGRFHLIQVRGGVQLAEHRDQRVKLTAGDCVLIDCMSGFEFSFPEGVAALVLEVRRDWLKSWLPAPEDAVGRVFRHDEGWGATLSSALDNITPASIGSADFSQHAVAEQIAGLLALAVGPGAETLTTHRRCLLRRVMETIRERCHERELDPTAVAAAMRLSRRYVHALFASAGTTFTRELYKCRLQRAERVLRDRKFIGVGIAEIAWNCGFGGASHFTRRFRESYGVAPSVYRAGR